MALLIYENASVEVPFSSSGLFTNSLIFTFDGRVGGNLERRFYIRNDNENHKYTSIQLRAEQFEGSLDLVEGTQGFSIKFKVGDTQPSLEEWNTIEAGNIVDFENIVGKADALPFWIQVTIPRQVSVQQFRGVRLKLLATQEII